jgi:acetyltransferase
MIGNAKRSQKFDPELMFRPSVVVVSGAATALGQRVLAGLTGFGGDVRAEGADVAIVADDPAEVPAALAGHVARGVKGAIVVSEVAGLAAMARGAKIRVMGPHSFGMMLPGMGLNASVLPVMPAAGKVAYIGQSGALARTVIDWAVPNSVGFSQVIGVGGNVDMGFGLILDHLSRDPGTNAIMIEVDRVRDPQAFHSAARAAARLRPVVALAPGLRLRDPGGLGRAAAEAAFARAGVLLTATMGEFLAAAETLTRVKPAHGESLAILSNSVAGGRLAADDALSHGLRLAALAPETAQVLGLSLGIAPGVGPIFVGRANPTRLADVAAMLSSAPEVGGILVVHAPGDAADDEVAMAALEACAKTVKVPLLIVAMGEASGLKHRHRLAAAGLACFDTPEAAIAGFRFLLRNRANRAAARELPASKVLLMAPDMAAVQEMLAAARAGAKTLLVQDEALALVAAYKVPVVATLRAASPEEAAQAAAQIGFPVVVKAGDPDMPFNRPAGSVALDLPDADAVLSAARGMLARLPGAEFVVQHQVSRGVPLRIRVADAPFMGPVIGFGAGGGDLEDISGLAVDLPPLNLPLAQALIARSGVAAFLAAHRGQTAADIEAVAACLVRVSQLIVDTPEILLLDLDPLFASADGVVAASARVVLRGVGEFRAPLVIPPYPAELTSSYEAKGRKFLLRPIRPEDADQHAALFARMPAEDMRYRFFSSVKNLPAEQIARMTDIDYAREMAIVAVDEAAGQTAGAARLVRNDTDGKTAEFAVAVDAGAKGLGLASALMRAVIAWGKARGVEEITGQILADNQPMLAFIKGLGFRVERVAGESDIVEAKLEP